MDDYEYCEALDAEFEAGIERGEERERERVVQWLRSEAGTRAVDQGYKSVSIAENLAQKLESAAHL